MVSAFKLILGSPLSATPKPWKTISIDGVMVNAYELLRGGAWRSLRGRGLRRRLGISDNIELWIDSGGYQFLRRGVTVDVEKLAKLYHEVDADYYISMDYPPSPDDSPRLRALKIARTIEYFDKLRSMLRAYSEEGRLVPVFHLATGSALRIQLAAYESSALVAAVGGLVPYFMQKAGKGSRLKAVVFLALLRRHWRDGRLHALGLASAAVIPLLKAIGIDSGDTQTWRHKAAYGKIIIPGLGERHVSKRSVSFGPAKIRNEELGAFKSIVEKASVTLGVTASDLEDSFEARAVFNAWILQLVARNGSGYMGPSRAFQRLVQAASMVAGLEPETLEAILVELLRGNVDTAELVALIEKEARYSGSKTTVVAETRVVGPADGGVGATESML